MTIDEQIAVLQAVKEGKKIEERWTGSTEWTLHQGPCNFVACNYRIVREPRRFIVYEWRGKTYAIPYGNHVPDCCKIVCTAVEEENIKTTDLARWCEDEAAKLVAQAKTVGTSPA